MLDDYRRMAVEFNEIGRRADENGFKFLYHNHRYGLAPLEGEIPLRVLLDRLDPSAVALEMDTYWTPTRSTIWRRIPICTVWFT